MTQTTTRDVRAIFASIDRMDVDAFVEALSDDVVFTFGNNPPAVGHDQVREGVTGFFSTIAGLTHHIQDIWTVDDVSIAYIDVEYVRQDGGHVTVPNADILRWRDGLVYDWRILIDLAPVFA